MYLDSRRHPGLTKPLSKQETCPFLGKANLTEQSKNAKYSLVGSELDVRVSGWIDCECGGRLMYGVRVDQVWGYEDVRFASG